MIYYLIPAILLCQLSFATAPLPDVRTVPIDLNVPAIATGKPAPGKRVKLFLPKNEGTALYHILYLPTDWQPNQRYPVIVEYAGNGPYKNQYGDASDGSVEGNVLGFGVSGGKGAIWLCLPYVNKAGDANQTKWWGDVDATVSYCKTVVPQICKDYGGDPKRVILAGFSRGAIACNFIGLHDDKIASLWRGFICYSHYDGVRKWQYPSSDRKSAATRLKRLKNRPQFIVHEKSTAQTESYLTNAYPNGNFTFLDLPFRNHNPTWVLRDTDARKTLREWFANITK